MHKYTVLMLVTCLVASSLIAHAVAPVFAQAGYKPSVPQFSLKIVSHPYDVAPIYTTNPYTGETVLATRGYHVENKTIDVTIKNQFFSSYTTSDGHYVNLCYNISIKPHYNDDWQYYPVMYGQIPLIAAKSDYTVVAFGPNAYTSYDDGVPIATPYYFAMSLPDSGQLDFRIEALIGYYTRVQEFWPIPGGPFYKYTFFGKSSGWSNIQTITINDGSTTINPEQPSITSDGNSQPQFSDHQTQPPDFIFSNSLFTLVVGVILGGIVVAVVMAFLRRHIKMPTYTNDSTQTNTLDVRCRYARKCTALVLITCLVVSILMVFSVTPTTV